MNRLRWPAPAPWPRISAAPSGVRVPGPAAGYTSAVVAAPVSSATLSSLGFFEGVTNFRVRLQLVRYRKCAEPRRERSGEHPIDVAADNAGQRHAPVLDDDVNRRVRHDRVVP